MMCPKLFATKPAILDTANLDYRPDNYEEGKTPTIILFDDFHLCDRVMQRYMFQLLTYKGLNDYQLDNNVAIILAGNRISDKAGAMPIPAPVANRMMFIEVTVDVKDWMLNFAFKNNVRGDIISFLNSPISHSFFGSSHQLMPGVRCISYE